MPNHHPPNMDVLPKAFLKIILAAKWLVWHSRTSPNQQRRPLPSLLSDSCSMRKLFDLMQARAATPSAATGSDVLTVLGLEKKFRRSENTSLIRIDAKFVVILGGQNNLIGRSEIRKCVHK